MRSQESKTLNKINLDIEPSLYPDSDRGNLKLFYELELFKSHYENTECPQCLEKYLETIDTLVQRGHMADFSTDMKIDKAVRTVKPIVIEDESVQNPDGDIHIHLDSNTSEVQTPSFTEKELVDLEYRKAKLELLKTITDRVKPRGE